MIDTEVSAVKKQLDERHKENGELRSEWVGRGGEGWGVRWGGGVVG